MNHEAIGRRAFLGSAAMVVAAGRGVWASQRDDSPFDLVVSGGRVIDGTGAPWFLADVGVKGGRVAAVGRLTDWPTRRTIKADGLYVAPGFIDMMGQTGAPFLTSRRAGDNLLTQGITTINAGEGRSDAPLDGAEAKKAGWSTMAEYLDRLDAAKMPMNVAQSVGHTQVRRIVVGETDRKATPEELERMKGLVKEAMEAGAIGVSTALIYPPAVYAPTEEIVALATVAGSFGGGYFTHMRNEGDQLLEAIDEALSIGKAAGAHVHIFHLKAAGRDNWPKMGEAIARIKAARGSGQSVGADIYPYINNGLGLASFVHPRHAAEGPKAQKKLLGDPAARAEIRHEMEEVGGWENWYRHIGKDWENVVLGQIKAPGYDGQNGRSLAEIARAAGKDPWDVFFEIAAAGAGALPRTMSEANLIKAMGEEFVSFCTDMGPAGTASALVHPRGAGAFPRVLGRFVRELGVMSVEEAVSKMTAVAANELTLHDRGRIAPGCAADLVAFDLDRVTDRSTFAEPGLAAEGFVHVLVNGEPVIESGKTTDAGPGRALRRGGSRTQ